MLHLAAAGKIAAVSAAFLAGLVIAANGDSTGSDHTIVTVALITGSFTFLCALTAAAAQILAPRFARQHIETAGEGVEAVVAQLVRAESERQAEEARKESAIRHANRQAQTIRDLRAKAIAAGVPESQLPPAPNDA